MTLHPPRTYLDYNATAPLLPVAQAAVMAFMERHPSANPSAVSHEGRAAKAAVERSRSDIKSILPATEKDVLFTSGATEANALVLASCAHMRVLYSAIEHPSVTDNARAHCPHHEIIPVTAAGVVDMHALEALLKQDDTRTPCLSVMAANNETGVIQPLADICALAVRYGALVHTDAVQAFGKTDTQWLAGADFITLSAHKLGGGTGVGAVLFNERGRAVLRPLLYGGGQEGSLRAGTENVLGIVSFAAAVRWHREQASAQWTRLNALRLELESAIAAEVPEAVIVAKNSPRLCNTTCVALPGLDSATQVMRMDLEHIAISAGAACSSGKVGKSPTLTAMQCGDAIINGAVRISLGHATTDADIRAFLNAWVPFVRHHINTAHAA